MEWLAAALVFIALLYFYPKWVGYGLVIALGFGGCAGLAIWFFSAQEEAERNKVEATIRNDATVCGAEFPIFAGFVNNSSRTVLTISFAIELRKRGYSGEVGRISSLSHDKILKPGESFGRCYKLPALETAISTTEIEPSLSYKWITFE